MPYLELDDVTLYFVDQGPRDGMPVVFSNSLGTDLALWDDVITHLPKDLRLIRYDTRGHGQSSCPPGPYGMGMLVRDAERLLDHLGVRECVFAGLSIGGMIAQGLAVKRLNQIRALVLISTAAKIGTPDMWRDRARAARVGGTENLADAVMEKWFSPEFLKSGHTGPWREMLARQCDEGYAACCDAISGTDFYTPTSGLRLPTLGIAGAQDRATPPDLVRETIHLIPGATFKLMRRAGHLPFVEDPGTFAGLLSEFLNNIGHTRASPGSC